MRDQALQDFLDKAAEALAVTTGPAAGAAGQVVARWQARQGVLRAGATRMAVCDWIAPALAGNAAPLAQAFAAIEGSLRWRPRDVAGPEPATFRNGHANALVLGPGGLEDRDDLWLGATVMAPATVYPDHDHPPAEVYLPLSPGEWWNAAMDWTDPGPGGFIYNPPGIRHAMRAGSAPFLALWFLPL